MIQRIKNTSLEFKLNIKIKKTRGMINMHKNPLRIITGYRFSNLAAPFTNSSFNSSSLIRTFNITERFPFSFTPVSVSHNIKSVSASFLSNKWLRFISTGRSTSPIKKAIGINIARIRRFFI